MKKPAARHDRLADEQRQDRFSGLAPIRHDDDERPSREDRSYGETIFTRPTVPLPRWLTGRSRGRRT